MNTRTLCILLLALSYSLGFGQRVSLNVNSPGGGQTASSGFKNSITIGLPTAGKMSSSGYQLGGGYWFGIETSGNGNTITIPTISGWNMISVPVKVNDYRKSMLFPTTTSEAYSFENGYTVQETLRNGPGYWLKFNNAQNLPMNGYIISQETIEVKKNWNMIGSLASPISTNSIIQIPPDIVSSLYFGYGNAGYQSTTTLIPGKGVWVKTRNAGKLVLNANAVESNVIEQKENKTSFQDFNLLTVAQKNDFSSEWSVQKLFFATAGISEIEIEQFELPPVPPANLFDVRFASGRFVEFISENMKEPHEFPLVIQSDGTALKLSWEIKDCNNIKFTLVERDGKKIKQCRMKGNGSSVSQQRNGVNYVIKAERIPESFRLYQNYPNPFNPTTKIHFDLPEPANVNLKVFDIVGREIATLSKNKLYEDGRQELTFDAVNIPSGVYFYRLEATSVSDNTKSYHQVKKMLLLR
jgi:hypothetical protein